MQKNFKVFKRTFAIAAASLLVISTPAHAGEVRLIGTGLPIDAANLASAVSLAPSGTTLRLIGNFNLSTCVACIAITKPVVIQGSNCGIGGLGACVPATAKIIGGVSPFYVSQGISGAPGIFINNLHFTNQLLASALIAKSIGRVEFNDNRVDNMIPMTLASILGPVNTRVGLGGAQFILRLMTADPNLAVQYPALAALGRLPQLLQGDIVFRRNTVDLLTNSPAPLILAEDNGIALGTCANSSVTISNNVVKTYGDSIQVEGCSVPSAPITITNNTVQLISPLKPEGVLYGWGSPAAIKLQSNANRIATVTGNTVTVTGTKTGTAITAGTTSPDAAWAIQNNTFSAQGQLTVIAGGNGGVPPLFLGSSLSYATISNNKFLGSAGYGVGFKDASTFVNTATKNLVQTNDFAGFTATTGYNVFLDHGTTYNTIKSVPLGKVMNLGTGNIIMP
jgi:hypothetical protein